MFLWTNAEEGPKVSGLTNLLIILSLSKSEFVHPNASTLCASACVCVQIRLDNLLRLPVKSGIFRPVC